MNKHPLKSDLSDDDQQYYNQHRQKYIKNQAKMLVDTAPSAAAVLAGGEYMARKRAKEPNVIPTADQIRGRALKIAGIGALAGAIHSGASTAAHNIGMRRGMKNKDEPKHILRNGAIAGAITGAAAGGALGKNIKSSLIGAGLGSFSGALIGDSYRRGYKKGKSYYLDSSES